MSAISATSMFLTAGADETIRMWNLDFRSITSSSSDFSVTQQNLYPSELKKIFYISNSLESLCEQHDSKFIFVK